MVRPISRYAPLALIALLMVACGPDDPETRVADLRAQYEAELSTFAVRQTPIEAPAPAPLDDADAASDEPAEPVMAGEGEPEVVGEAEPVEVPTRQDVLLDILLSRSGYDELPGITLDITHVGPNEQVKQVYREYVDATRVPRGSGIQVVHTLEDVDFVDGDGFHVEVRHPIPAGERGEYREFSETAEGNG